MPLGIIGFGRLGALLTRHLAADCAIKVHEKRPGFAASIKAAGGEPASLAEVCRQDVVVPCVPIAGFEGVLRQVRGLLRPGTLVVDVCSVKERPVRLMKALLPRAVEILATHPNFGPDSAAESLGGRQVAVCRVRIAPERYRRVKAFLERKGLELVEMTPKEHDKRMASSLLLTHFIGRALVGFGARPTGMDTEGFKRLLRILQTVSNDSWQLFEDMNRYNAYAPAMRRRFQASLRSVDRRVSR
ncbi:MAG: prephenate dehydrogenase/arogenate dehydrogenase family protein [Elusimicrobia bacterium]|nr:prephenate dehydrogenase/arogenate dehydrogenase family protein [Elusimicrobiota bacterium]